MLSEQQQRIMGYFIEEAKDHLNTIEQGLLNLQSTIQDPEMVNEVFRAAHSVKGGAAMLGLSSIQNTSHRLEDYFKVLKECPQVRVDQRIETLFLRVFDTLQELLEQLQGPFGLTDDKSSEVMARVEPVFSELNQHLSLLVSQAGSTLPEDVDLTASTVAQPQLTPLSQPPIAAREESALQLIFRSDVPARLRDMLQLFKQPDTSDSRAQLQSLCQALAQPGEQLALPAWCNLLELTRQAIANPDNSYRILAPIVIRDIKRAQELVLAGCSTEISACEDLIALLPFDAEPVDEALAVDADLADLLATLDSSESNDEPTLMELGDFADAEPSDLMFNLPELTLESTETAADDWFSNALLAQSEVPQAVTSSDSEFDLGLPDPEALLNTQAPAENAPPLDLIDHPDETPGDRPNIRVGPEVGVAELNSLADLFEGDVPDLSLTWEEEEIIEAADPATLSPDTASSNEFSDLFDYDAIDDLPLDEIEEEDLSGLLNNAAQQTDQEFETEPSSPNSLAHSMFGSDNLAEALQAFDFSQSDEQDESEQAMFFAFPEQGNHANSGLPVTSAESGLPDANSSSDGFENLDELFANLDDEESASNFNSDSEALELELELDELTDIFGNTPETAGALFETINTESSSGEVRLPDFALEPDLENDETGNSLIDDHQEILSVDGDRNAADLLADQPEDEHSQIESLQPVDNWFADNNSPEMPLSESMADPAIEPDDLAALFSDELDRTATAAETHSDFTDVEDWLTHDRDQSSGSMQQADTEANLDGFDDLFAMTQADEHINMAEADSAIAFDDGDLDLEALLEDTTDPDAASAPEFFSTSEMTLDEEPGDLSESDLFNSAETILNLSEQSSSPEHDSTLNEFDSLFDQPEASRTDEATVVLNSDGSVATEPLDLDALIAESSHDSFDDSFELSFNVEPAEDPSIEQVMLPVESADITGAARLENDLDDLDALDALDLDVFSLSDEATTTEATDASFSNLDRDSALEFFDGTLSQTGDSPEEDEFAQLNAIATDETITASDDLIPDVTEAEPDDLMDLEALLVGESGQIPSNSDEFADDSFADLEAMLGDSLPVEAVSSPEQAVVTGGDEFSDLDALLDNDIAAAAPPSSSPQASAKSTTEDEFGDLEALLQEANQKLGPTPERSSSRPAPRRPNPRMMDQTMRVSVKHLDNLNNLVGEMVVNRNSLEQAQERLRQFLDNLLYQVQQLSDVGQRMRDLYERSLLESSLLSSRRGYQLPSQNSAFSTAQTNHATGALFDALEMDRFTGFHTLSQEMIELIVRVRESASDIDFVVEESDQVTRNFRQITTQLQEGLTRARMVPFAQTADRLPRGVRDNSLKYGKQAELVIEGRDTLIDKMIVEQLYDPMTHLVNNAIAHGIETPQERTAAGKPPTGKIVIRTYHQGNQTIISVSDDGAGIDPDMVKAKAVAKGLITSADASQMSRLDIYDLLFHHGFSTADQVDDLKGRGVGLDVVRNNLNEIRGSITIDSAIGKGTTFTIRLPLTLSISKALCCISNRARIAFPMDGVEDMLDVPKERIQTDDEGRSCIYWRDALLPFQSLSDLLRYNRTLGRGSVYGGNQEEDIISIVVLRSAGNFLALQVDQVLGEQEIVIKQLEGPVPKPVGVAGATVLGDGRIMPIADVLELIDLWQGRIRRETGGSLWDKHDEQTPIEAVLKSDPTVLIVDDSITVRELLSMTFNKVGYRVEQARDGQEAWEKLRSGLPCDLVFCDIEMPRMDGLELLSRIQKDPNLSHLPIAMLTSRGADRHRQMAVQLGARGYFTKPYLEEVLLDAAQRMLKGEVLVVSNSQIV
jgi:chemosensory pili system protein ChpA (sensor histidine kinase/response regulator)